MNSPARQLFRGANAAPTAHAVTYWGAIAYAPNGQAGASHDYATKGDAEGNALTACGLASCKVLTSFTGCAAVANDGHSYQGGSGRLSLRRSKTPSAGWAAGAT